MMDEDCRAYLPPEWSRQSGVMLTWPHANGDWGSSLAAVEGVFSQLVAHISNHEKVLIVSAGQAHQQRIKQLLRPLKLDNSAILHCTAPSNDAWARDHAPLTVICSAQPQLLDFQFNGWGGKYDASLDNDIGPLLYQQGLFGELPMETIKLVLEGGSIEVDGSGTLMATRSSVLSPSRNAGLSPSKIEEMLAHYFGIEQFLWLNNGALKGDDTDGHIDTLARFCDRDTIVYCSCDDKNNANYDSLAAMHKELKGFRSITNAPYELVPLPLPSPIRDNKNYILPATYVNFLIINNAILMPTYGDAADDVALETLRSCFPKREVVGINALPLIEQHGSLHCVTMQFPEGVL